MAKRRTADCTFMLDGNWFTVEADDAEALRRILVPYAKKARRVDAHVRRRKS